MSDVHVLNEGERLALRQFREVAAQVRSSSVISSGVSYQVLLSFDSRKGATVRTDLPEESFHALMIPVRKVLLNKEKTKFGRICNTLAKLDPTIRGSTTELRDQFASSYDADPLTIMTDNGELNVKALFDDWVNGVQFHSDQERATRYREHREQLGPVIDWIVQSVAFRLAGRILDLDDLVADFLAEPRLPRITAGIGLSSAASRLFALLIQRADENLTRLVEAEEGRSLLDLRGMAFHDVAVELEEKGLATILVTATDESGISSLKVTPRAFVRAGSEVLSSDLLVELRQALSAVQSTPIGRVPATIIHQQLDLTRERVQVLFDCLEELSLVVTHGPGTTDGLYFWDAELTSYGRRVLRGTDPMPYP